MGAKVVALSDAHTSPIVRRSDQYLVIDLDAVSFIDPFEHVIAFLGSLAHEIAFLDRDSTTERLTVLERGMRARNEYYSEEGNAQEYDFAAVLASAEEGDRP